MVYMTHNTDYRRTLLHLLFVLFLFLQKFLYHIHDLFFFTEDLKLQSNFLCRLIIDLLVYGHDFSLQEKLFHNHRRDDLHLICQFFDCKNFRNYN